MASGQQPRRLDRTRKLDPDLTRRLSREQLMRSLPPASSLHGDLDEEPAVEQDLDPWKVVLPQRMENRQELTLLSLPDNPEGVIGEGGQALIYAYVQRELGREVAVKTLKPGRRSAEAIGNLIREACVTARLEHPNIVPVHYLHLPAHMEDAPYWVMKRIVGKGLTAHLPGGEDPWPSKRLLETFRRILDAVAFAHSRGIVHRDLKPDNVLVGRFGEVQVTDWGLAVAINEEGVRGAVPCMEAGEGQGSAAASRDDAGTDLTPEIAALNRRVRSGTIGATPRETAGGRAGTPAYMAPEQLDTSAESIDERTDVFLLGGILYSMLTGEPPHHFSQASGERGPRRRCDEITSCSTILDPVPRRKELGITADTDGLPESALPSLGTLVMKALSPESSKRFQRVDALAAALDAWEAQSASEELCARAEERLEAAGKTRRRQAAIYAEALALADAALERVKTNERAKRLREVSATRLAAIQRRSSRRLIAAAAAIALVFVVGIIGYQRTRAQRSRAVSAEQQALGERDRALAAEKQARTAQVAEAEQRKTAQDALAKSEYESYCNAIALAAQKIEAGDTGQGQRILWKTPRKLRHWEWGRLMSLCHPELVAFDESERSHYGRLGAFSHAGGRVAIIGGKGVDVWDALTDLFQPIWHKRASS